MARSDCFKLTEYAKTDLLAELNLIVKAKAEHSLIKFDSFTEKRLIYSGSEQRQINELSSILSADRFKKVQSRLQNAGMRTGFCCLFYGSPGTGKTETVYQIARATGRHILRVDVNEIKSCWVGESEQNIKSCSTDTALSAKKCRMYRFCCSMKRMPYWAYAWKGLRVQWIKWKIPYRISYCRKWKQ